MRFRTLALLAMTAITALIVAGGAAAAWAEQAPAINQAPAVIRLSLAEAIRRALDEGTATQLATERVGEAEARAVEAHSVLEPQVSAGGQLANETFNLATFGFSQPGLPNVTPPFNVVDTHLTVAMNIIDLA